MANQKQRSVGIGKRRLSKIQKYLDEQYPDLRDMDVTFVVSGFKVSRHDKSIGIWTLISEDGDRVLGVKIPMEEMEETAGGKVVNVLKSAAGPALFLLLMALLQKSSDIRVCPAHQSDWSDSDLFDMM